MEKCTAPPQVIIVDLIVLQRNQGVHVVKTFNSTIDTGALRRSFQC
jgi:hypothetical protein